MSPATRPFHDRVAVVTGGGTGIGAAISARLADMGAAVIVGQSTPERADAAVERLRGPGRTLHAVGGDLALSTTCTAVVAAATDRYGRIDILVNNAGVSGPAAVGPLLQFDDDRLDRVVDVNLKAAFRCSREAARTMVVTGAGVIVNISSVGAFAAQRHASAYVAAKAGMVGLTKGLAFELAPFGIRVVGVAPGDIALSATSGSGTPDTWAPGSWWERRTPLGRRGSPVDVAATVAFLASDDAAFITGTTVLVDGGWLSY